ncbi:MAG: SDR family oxidoreductase [Acidobacteriia bacterium]|nr:SDR family oxidoreductase [Terriglobia bacterium]
MANPLDLSGQTILVTGASSGIGRSTAVLLSELGARVVLSGRNAERLEQTAAGITNNGHHIAGFDLSRLEEIPAWLGGLVKEVGPLSAFVHCAGLISMLPVRYLELKHLHEVMTVNFCAAALLTKEFSRKQIRRPKSSIVFVASAAGLVAAPGRAVYSASKGALIAFARSAAVELAPQGIRVNCVAPGLVQTEAHEGSGSMLTAEQIEALVNTTQPLGWGTPLDVAHAIAFLLADTGRWITGSVLCVDGGYIAQ